MITYIPIPQGTRVPRPPPHAAVQNAILAVLHIHRARRRQLAHPDQRVPSLLPKELGRLRLPCRVYHNPDLLRAVPGAQVVVPDELGNAD